jgi:hypothetical protein
MHVIGVGCDGNAKNLHVFAISAGKTTSRAIIPRRKLAMRDI